MTTPKHDGKGPGGYVRLRQRKQPPNQCDPCYESRLTIKVSQQICADCKKLNGDK